MQYEDAVLGSSKRLCLVKVLLHGTTERFGDNLREKRPNKPREKAGNGKGVLSSKCI